MTQEHPGRVPLQAWEAAKPKNVYAHDENLQRVLCAYVGEDRMSALEPRFHAFGETVASIIDPLLRPEYRPEHQPRLRRFTPLGERVEAVEFHPNHAEVGRHIWSSGIMALQREPGRLLEQATLFYLLCYVGEGGHACPIACTAGLARALQWHGSPELQGQYLPPLLEEEYDRAHRGAQFLTEVQGGSDVGANIVRAEPADDAGDVWRIVGEKWFCSVIDADQFLMTARPRGAPEGTRGLGCFLVPRRLPDGTLNHFSIRRLKEKLGTRLLATAEVDFDGALAWPIGRLDEGYKIAIGVVLNTSRWLNAVACAGIMRRALVEASTFAVHRTAFGHPIAAYPMVQEHLVTIRALTEAAVASTFYLTALFNRLELGLADGAERAFWRFLVNANKYATAVDAGEAVHRAIDVLGGNGTIEDFSVLPRLYRDQLVLETWEGTPNVLALQVMRDFARLEIGHHVWRRLESILAEVKEPRLRAEVRAVQVALDRLRPLVGETIGSPVHMHAHARRLVERLMRVTQAACLLREAAWECRHVSSSEKPDVVAFYVRRFLTPGYDPLHDSAWTTTLGQLTSTMLPTSRRQGDPT
ncbi:MAG: acyl-CoA dehydrogenase family protein [Ardenticatenia bacterium]|nr:acyl-CoA dehydrogenase family protein [Ardenticatenia bacterium]